MRIYRKGQEFELEKVTCNCCGRELKLLDGALAEGCFQGKNIFGYFSEKDGIRAEFDLCEACYEKMVSKFVIPVTETEVTEFL